MVLTLWGQMKAEWEYLCTQPRRAPHVLSLSQPWGPFHASYTSDSLGLSILANRTMASPRHFYVPEIINLVRVKACLSFFVSVCFVCFMYSPALARYLAYGQHILNIYEIKERKYHQICQASRIKFLRKVRHIRNWETLSSLIVTLRWIILIKQLEIFGKEGL